MLTCLFDLWQYQDRPVFAEQPFNPNRANLFVVVFPISLGRWVATSFLLSFCEVSNKYVFEFPLL